MSQLHKLNPSQIIGRAKQVAELMDGVAAISCVEILRKAGIWPRLESGGWTAADGGPAPASTDDDLQAAYDIAIKDGLERGDTQIMKLWKDQKDRKAAEAGWDIQVLVTPYRIQDATLERIVLEAEEETISKVARGFITRATDEGCPPELIASITDAMERFLGWAAQAWAAQDGTDASDREIDEDARLKLMEAVDDSVEVDEA